MMLTPGGKPRMFDKRLREVLGQVAEEYADSAPFIASWLRMEETAKLLQFFRKLQKKRVHPRYCVVVRTGRTSCSSPNIQLMPKAGTFREMFVPRQGHAFLIIDYNALELRTLAKVCLDSFGYSVLGETIQAGRDPYCYTASLLSGLGYEQFMELKDTDLAKFKQNRQAAKAVNFGVPGGLSSDTLRDYARTNYQIDMSPEDANEFR
ncbi:MAG: DNA polymerase [Pirellulales bacterium]